MWRILAWASTAFGVFWGGIKILFDSVGYVDAFIAHRRELGWLAAVIEFLLNPPGWTPALMALLGLCFILLANRRMLNKTTAALAMDPEKVKHSPLYLKLVYQLHPDTGVFVPVRRIEAGLEELLKLSDLAQRGDREAYFLAVHVGEWVLQNSRRWSGNDPRTAAIQNTINEKMEAIHDSAARQIAPPTLRGDINKFFRWRGLTRPEKTVASCFLIACSVILLAFASFPFWSGSGSLAPDDRASPRQPPAIAASDVERKIVAIDEYRDLLENHVLKTVRVALRIQNSWARATIETIPSLKADLTTVHEEIFRAYAHINTLQYNFRHFDLPDISKGMPDKEEIPNLITRFQNALTLKQTLLDKNIAADNDISTPSAALWSWIEKWNRWRGDADAVLIESRRALSR